MSRFLEGLGYLFCSMAFIAGAQSASAVLPSVELPFGLCVAKKSCELNTDKSCKYPSRDCNDNMCLCEEQDTTRICNCMEI